MKNTAYYPIDTLATLSDDLNTVLKSVELKDVTFFIGEKRLKAHKVVLAARSPVFKRMFSTEMQELRTNKVVVSDINCDTFKEMLHFIYTGKVTDNFETVVMELYAASHKYQLDDLKSICVAEISENLSETNAEAILEFANIYDCDENLKNEAHRLFKR